MKGAKYGYSRRGMFEITKYMVPRGFDREIGTI